MKLSFKSKKLAAQQEAYLRQHPEDQLEENLFRTLMDKQLSRGFLNEMPPAEEWEMERSGLSGQFDWLRFTRLPIQPGKEEENTLLESWQSVLSACHTMGMQVAFVLLRRHGHTEVYLGACSSGGTARRAAQQLRQCVAIHMPGAELQPPRTTGALEGILENFESSGVVTGIPSLRRDNAGVSLQTMDKLSRGVRIDGKEKDYALVVLADPATDREIVELQQRLLSLKTELHQCIAYSASESFTEGESTSRGVFLKMMVAALLVAAATPVSAPVAVAGALGMGGAAGGAAVGAGAAAGAAGGTGALSLASGLFGSNSKSFSATSGVTREYKDFVGDYCQTIIDKNIARLEQGRNLGFWQAGVYVLSDDGPTTDAVLGVLRSVYSGRESFVEPIRVFNTGANPAVTDFVGRLRFLPLPGSVELKREAAAEAGLAGGWHVLGRMYESFTTALTTEELSISSSLPRREVPGLRMVKNAVSFANNAYPAQSPLELGRLVDMGTVQETRYTIDVNALVRHILVCGSTGSGKSTTCKRIIRGVREKNVPVLIIEPAKDDYVRWAIEENKHLPEDQQYRIFMPGASQVEGVRPEELWLNLFQPAAWGDSPVNLVQHAEQITTLLNACLPSEDVIPVIIEEAVHACLEKAAADNDIDLTRSENPAMVIYPILVDLMVAGDRIVSAKTYENRTKENFREILNTRFRYLARGTRGGILDQAVSTNFEELFSRPAVVNLSLLAGSKDKGLITSLLLLALQEYRMSRYRYDPEYRARADRNELLHLTVVEEAHNVLRKPSPINAGGGDPQQAAAELFGNMLSEIRSYGQGMMIVDQVPTRLIEDAMKNTNYKIAHRLTTRDDVETMAASMSLRQDQEAVISSLEIGNAIVCGDMDDAAAWVRVSRG